MASVHSMTGFGAASQENEILRVEVELRSVNNRFLKIITKTSDELNLQLNEIEKVIRSQINRGTVYCTVRFTAFGEAPCRINWYTVSKYFEECQRAIAIVPIADAVTIDTLLDLPGVIEPRQMKIDKDRIQTVLEVIKLSLEKLIEMRKTEGEKLKNDCLEKIREIENTLGNIKKLAPNVAEEYRVKLTERINNLMAGTGTSFTSDEFAKEVALYADKCSIDEEIDRMGSHLAQFVAMLNAGGVIGRNLEFLVQEMFREANTMSAKTQNIELIGLILNVKSGIDKLREQVANFE